MCTIMKQLIFIILFLSTFYNIKANEYLIEISLGNYTKEQPQDPDPINDRNLNIMVFASINMDSVNITTNMPTSNVYLTLLNTSGETVYSCCSNRESCNHFFKNVSLCENENYTMYVTIGDCVFIGNFSL